MLSIWACPKFCLLVKTNILTLYDKILDQSRLTAFADDKKNATGKLVLVVKRVENIVEKGGNAGYKHFLLIPQCFRKTSSFRS